MVIKQISGLLSTNVHHIAILKQRQVASLLPALLRSCVLQVTRINSSCTKCLKPRFPNLSTVSVKQLSTSCLYASKKPTGKRPEASPKELCQVFDNLDMLIGQMTVHEAEELARKDGMKLLALGDNSDHVQSFRLLPGREMAAESKRQRQEKKASKVKEKELRITTNITDHDLDTKLRQAKSVLDKNGQIKFVIRAHKRSDKGESDKAIAHMLKKITAEVKDHAVIKQGLRSPTELQLLLRPLPTAQQTDVEQN